MNTNKMFNDIFFDNLEPQEQKMLRTQLFAQLSRELFIKVEIMSVANKVINEVAGRAINGSYNIDNSASLRRTCSVTFLLESNDVQFDTLKSDFAINKKFVLYVGLRQIGTNNICWFNKGTYAIKDPNISIAIGEQTITINGLDKMALHNGDISGQLEYATIIDPEEEPYVHDAVSAIMTSRDDGDGGETKLNIAETDLLIPYKIESAIGDTRYDVIEKLTNLFYDYQAYYDIDGTFVFAKKPTSINESNAPTIDFSDKNWKNLIISINRDIAYSNVKNKIVVYGGVHDDGYQPNYTKEVTDSPYSKEKLKEDFYRMLVIQDDIYVDAIITFEEYDAETNNEKEYSYNMCVKYKVDDEYIYYLCNTDTVDNKTTPNNDNVNWKKICTQTELDNAEGDELNDYLQNIHAYSIDRCRERADGEAYLHQQATDTVQINCVPIYSLDVNEVIDLEDEQSGIQGKYVINNISCGLGASDTMTITANRLW